MSTNSPDDDLKSRLNRRTAAVVVDMQKDYCVRGGIIDLMGYDVTGSADLAKRMISFLESDQSFSRVDHFCKNRNAFITSIDSAI